MERGLLPENVCGRDGTLEPFEPEQITRSLFAVAERIGVGDPLLARELTEGVLHFLSVDREGTTTTGEEIAEITEKIVRELGHPALARAYRERKTPVRIVKEPILKKSWPGWLQANESAYWNRRQAATDRLTSFSLAEVYPAELASAHREGLLRIGGLGAPFELAGITANITLGWVQQSLQEVGNLAGDFIAVDSPEHELACWPGEPAELASRYVQEVSLASELLDVDVILNLNAESPPPRLSEGTGPLFQGNGPDSRGRRQAIARGLAQQGPLGRVIIFWHANELSEPMANPGLVVVLDRPRSPVRLGPGLDRQTPATLVQVGVNLPRLAQMLGGRPITSELFLKKLASLTRFAKTAGHAKQDFLRKHGRPELKEGFLLERARLVLIPEGLEEVATMSELPPAEFIREIPRAMKMAAEQDRPRTLPVRIESEGQQAESSTRSP
ncbi:MAG: hypothetical protein EXS09_06715 [Gemmataceae bacterium]|nr:hypothetical protein [Gemmataceae bacterium]